jgi:hypothetical protein
MATKTTYPVTFTRGEPPECGRYLVTDGHEIGTDLWWEEVDGCVRLASQIGKPTTGTVVRRWMRYENVIAWADHIVPVGVFPETLCPETRCATN